MWRCLYALFAGVALSRVVESELTIDLLREDVRQRRLLPLDEDSLGYL